MNLCINKICNIYLLLCNIYFIPFNIYELKHKILKKNRNAGCSPSARFLASPGTGRGFPFVVSYASVRLLLSGWFLYFLKFLSFFFLWMQLTNVNLQIMLKWSKGRLRCTKKIYRFTVRALLEITIHESQKQVFDLIGVNLRIYIFDLRKSLGCLWKYSVKYSSKYSWNPGCMDRNVKRRSRIKSIKIQKHIEI